MDRPAPDYPPILPDLRRRIVIEDWDFGHRVHVLELHRTSRIDCYRVVADGQLRRKRRICAQAQGGDVGAEDAGSHRLTSTKCGQSSPTLSASGIHQRTITC